MLVGAFLWVFALAGVAVLPNYVSAQEGTGWFGNQNKGYNPDVPGSKTDQEDSLIKTIQTAINWVLGMLSLIAVVLCLYAGFLMMTSSGDSKKYEKGTGILKWAAIGLAVIALSWLFVSLIFWLINQNVQVKEA